MIKKTAIILVNWNSFYHTNNCIQSIKESNAEDYDIILVDNGSEDNSGLKLLDKYPDIIFISSIENIGFTGGNNIALRFVLSKGYKYSLLLNNDTFVSKNFLEPLVTLLENNSNIAAAQPKIFFNSRKNILWNGGSIYNSALGMTYSKRYLRLEGEQQKRIHSVDWITGCAFFINNSILKETGLLAENMFMYFEDVDLSMRIRQKGYLLYFHPDSIIYHVAGAANTNKEKNEEGYSNPQVYYINFRNRIWFLKKYTPFYFIPTALIYNFFYFLFFLFYFLGKKRTKKINAVLNGIKDGIKGRIKY